MTFDPHGDAAAREAHVFARYLVGRTPPPAAVVRYREARRTVWADDALSGDPLVAFVRRHPWSVAPLDAAASLLQRGGPLHGSILTMAAILETMPEFADEFLPRSVSRAGLLWRVGADGIVMVFQVLAGLLLLPVARRRRA